MGRLGDFGTPRPAVDDTFGYFGAELRVHPDLSDLVLVDLFRRMGGGDGDGAAADAVRGIADVLVHPDDAEEFWRLARANRQTVQDLAEFAMQLVGAITERPTRLPSDSSAGQSTTGPSSTDASSSPALRLLEGRPDLQVAVVRAQEAQAG